MKTLFMIFAFAFLALQISPLQATPLNSWKISCGADKGSIVRKAGTWKFKTSSNKCPGGIFKQRAEISTRKISPKHKGAYKFQSYVTMKTSNSEKFDIFQIHDGRRGCAPPLKVEVLRSGQLKLVSDIKTGPGESCIRGALANKVSSGKISRNGSEQKLEVLIDFDGKGGFEATVWIDGVHQIQGKYQLPKNKGYFRSKFFYFKHGVYSQRKFDYVLSSRAMKVRRFRSK